ncbi:MAG: alpha-ketoglutarate-dependent dioxygenase AlkB [Actinomycetota bacterium]|nr:alpha-ketoglutarate-dependent dioxygenase AlkB [Actinomycetota bacterium]
MAWHGDRIGKEIVEPVVAIVSVGHPRKFLLRHPATGARRSFLLGRGDLLVTGGACQRRWQHSVPKVASAGPRISITFATASTTGRQPRDEGCERARAGATLA